MVTVQVHVLAFVCKALRLAYYGLALVWSAWCVRASLAGNVEQTLIRDFLWERTMMTNGKWQ